jgi:tRNA G18 (ribose-2'-O)-methylase SpoU
VNEINLIPLTDPHDPRVGEYRQLRQNRLLGPVPGAPEGLFIAEGDKVVRVMLSAGLYPCRSVLLAEPRLHAALPWLADLPLATPVYVAPQPVMDQIAGFAIHRGVLASGLRRPEPDLAQTLAHAGALLVLEGLANHDNLGGLFRAAAALAQRPALVLDPTCCDPLYRKAVRVSMGHALRVPYLRPRPWTGVIERLHGLGFTTLALCLDPDAEPITTIGPVSRPALLLGAEGPGLTQSLRTQARRRVRIPMTPGIDSLNVVTAAAVALHRLCADPTRPT